jgi:hypothetical protein
LKSIVCFMGYVFGFVSKKSLPNRDYKDLMLFFSRNVRILGLGYNFT